ncbi:MAG: DUF620 domain-containing protein [Phycisphaerales bacterium]|nr:DUF620 domain-containing protein [Phycisphaerales bacterium]
MLVRCGAVVLALSVCAAPVAFADDTMEVVPVEISDAPAEVSAPAEVIVPPTATTANATLPTGAEVLDRFIEVTGGADAYAAIRDRVMTGSLEYVGMGITAKVKGYYAEPRMTYLAMETEGLGLVEEGCNGEVVWTKSMMQGPQVLKGASRAFKLRADRFNAEYHWRELYVRAECTGREAVEGQDCYKVVRYRADGGSDTAYFAAGSGLLVRMDYVATTPMGEIPVQMVREEYREVGGVKIAHREIMRTMGREQRVDFDKIRVNTKMAPERFDLPDDIKMLARRHGWASPNSGAVAGGNAEPMSITAVAAAEPVGNATSRDRD